MRLESFQKLDSRKVWGFMQARRFTTTMLEKQTGMSGSQIRKVLRADTARVRNGTVYLIADALQVQPDEIVLE